MAMKRRRSIPALFLAFVTTTLSFAACSKNEAQKPVDAATSAAPLTAVQDAAPGAGGDASSSTGAPVFDGPLATRFCTAAFVEPDRAALRRCGSDNDKIVRDILKTDQTSFETSCGRAFSDRLRVVVDEGVLDRCAAMLSGINAIPRLHKSAADTRDIYKVAACHDVVRGKQNEGDACADDAQCKAGFTCLGLHDDGREGTCHKAGNKGQPCDDKSGLEFAPEHEECAVGLGCIDHVCALVRDDGAACDRHPACRSDYCRIPNGSDHGVCATRSALGGACSKNDDCANGRCESHKCVDRSKAGSPCSASDDCYGACDDTRHVCVSECGSG